MVMRFFLDHCWGFNARVWEQTVIDACQKSVIEAAQ